MTSGPEPLATPADAERRLRAADLVAVRCSLHREPMALAAVEPLATWPRRHLGLISDEERKLRKAPVRRRSPQ